MEEIRYQVNGETPVFAENIGRAMARDLADRRAATPEARITSVFANCLSPCVTSIYREHANWVITPSRTNRRALCARRPSCFVLVFVNSLDPVCLHG